MSPWLELGQLGIELDFDQRSSLTVSEKLRVYFFWSKRLMAQSY